MSTTSNNSLTPGPLADIVKEINADYDIHVGAQTKVPEQTAPRHARGRRAGHLGRRLARRSSAVVKAVRLGRLRESAGPVMAEYHKGGTGADSLGAKDMVGPKVWAVFPHWKGDIATKEYGNSTAVRAEVYEITDDARADHAGSALFFQVALRKLPLDEWSVGRMVGPGNGRSSYGLVYPDDRDTVISKVMAELPDRPDIPEEPAGPFDDEQPSAAVAEQPAKHTYAADEEPF